MTIVYLTIGVYPSCNFSFYAGIARGTRKMKTEKEREKKPKEILFKTKNFIITLFVVFIWQTQRASCIEDTTPRISLYIRISNNSLYFSPPFSFICRLVGHVLCLPPFKVKSTKKKNQKLKENNFKS